MNVWVSVSEHGAGGAIEFEHNYGDVVLAATLQRRLYNHLSDLLGGHVVVAE